MKCIKYCSIWSHHYLFLPCIIFYGTFLDWKLQGNSFLTPAKFIKFHFHLSNIKNPFSVHQIFPLPTQLWICGHLLPFWHWEFFVIVQFTADATENLKGFAQIKFTHIFWFTTQPTLQLSESIFFTHKSTFFILSWWRYFYHAHIFSLHMISSVISDSSTWMHSMRAKKWKE